MKMAQKNAWNKYKKDEIKELESLCKDYREFLDNGKTERECVKRSSDRQRITATEILKKIIKNKGESLAAGDKVYAVWMNKTVAMFNIGKKKLEKGMNILGAHIDSPSNGCEAESALRRADLHISTLTITLQIFSYISLRSSSRRERIQ